MGLHGLNRRGRPRSFRFGFRRNLPSYFTGKAVENDPPRRTGVGLVGIPTYSLSWRESPKFFFPFGVSTRTRSVEALPSLKRISRYTVEPYNVMMLAVAGHAKLPTAAQQTCWTQRPSPTSFLESQDLYVEVRVEEVVAQALSNHHFWQIVDNADPVVTDRLRSTISWATRFSSVSDTASGRRSPSLVVPSACCSNTDVFEQPEFCPTHWP